MESNDKPKKKPGPATAYTKRVSLYETEAGLDLLNELARRRGVSQAALLRLLVREEAARKGLLDETGAE